MPALKQAGTAPSNDRFSPSGLDRLFEKAGDDMGTLRLMLLAMDQLIARRNDVADATVADVSSSLLTRS